jgi:hypothetical protein
MKYNRGRLNDSTADGYRQGGENDVRHMQSRAQHRSAFVCIRVGEVRLEVSYAGTKRFVPNVESLPLRMKELTYKDKVWTMGQLADQVARDVAREVGPQAVAKVASHKFSNLLGRSSAPSTPGQPAAAMGAMGALLCSPDNADAENRSREDRAAFSVQERRAMLFGDFD